VQETTSFLAENKGYELNLTEQIPPPLTGDSVDAMHLKDFLQRPVKISSFTWAETDNVGTVTTIEPWYLFFNDSRIKSKLNNFAFIQCSLKIKIVINASPFYYGAMMASYHPLKNFSGYTSATMPTGNSNEHLMLYSQRPHVWIFPQGNQGADMALPYLNFRNWTRVALIQDFKDLGEINFINYTALQSANATTGTGVTVTIFAWAEDVELSGATLGLALAQAGDEYVGVVSQPSSLISRAAGTLSNLPIIGPFARATSIGAGAIASIAHIFGFTNVPNIGPVHAFQPRPFHNFADTSISYPIDKLTLDAKNELSVSQKVAGSIDLGDPLIIDQFIQRESFLCQTSWDSTIVPDDIIFSSTVTPALCSVDSHTTPQAYSTPMSYVAAMFQQWRGDIIFRFRVIASPFHKGRFRICYDPYGYSGENVISDSSSYSGCFNQIVDIGKDTNIEFRVPYSQATSFQNLQTFGVQTWSTSKTPSFLYDPSKDNGTIVLRAVTALSGPTATPAIQILISIRSANVEFANPGFYPADSGLFSPLAAQGSVEYDDVGENIVAGPPSHTHIDTYNIYYGERIVSLRQILKRMCQIWAIDQRETYHARGYTALTIYRVPPTYGYDANGLYTYASILAGANAAFNSTPLNPITWLTPCFVGQRGSINYAVNSTPYSGTPRAEISVHRVSSVSVANNVIANDGTDPASYAKTSEFKLYTYSKQGTNGSSLQTGQTNQGFEFAVPNMAQYKFQTTNPLNATNHSTSDGSDKDCVKLQIAMVASGTGVIEVYAGAGADFNLIFFLNCPVIYKYQSRPAAT